MRDPGFKPQRTPPRARGGTVQSRVERAGVARAAVGADEAATVRAQVDAEEDQKYYPEGVTGSTHRGDTRQAGTEPVAGTVAAGGA